MSAFARWWLTLATGVLFLVACSADRSPDAIPPPDASASPADNVSPDPDAGHTVLGAGTEGLAAGAYELDLDADGSAEDRLPSIVITVPEGWENGDGWVVHNGDIGTDRFVAVLFWDVDEVYTHPCRWGDGLARPGPSVADLATALTDQPLRDATEPVDIVVGGFEGVQLELSVPADMPTDRYERGGDVYSDFLGCDKDPSVGDHPFKSWTGELGSWGGSERYQQGPGQVDRLWILDVNGERLVIDATYMPGTDAKERKELWQVMESIRFET